jgi:hypothetical protein
MNPNLESTEPTAADYRALIDKFNEAARAYNSGEIGFLSFRELIAEIDGQTRSLNLLRKLHRTLRSLTRQRKNNS